MSPPQKNRIDSLGEHPKAAGNHVSGAVERREAQGRQDSHEQTVGLYVARSIRKQTGCNQKCAHEGGKRKVPPYPQDLARCVWVLPDRPPQKPSAALGGHRGAIWQFCVKRHKSCLYVWKMRGNSPSNNPNHLAYLRGYLFPHRHRP